MTSNMITLLSLCTQVIVLKIVMSKEISPAATDIFLLVFIPAEARVALPRDLGLCSLLTEDPLFLLSVDGLDGP